MNANAVRDLAAAFAQAAADAARGEDVRLTRSQWVLAVTAAHRIALKQLRHGCHESSVRLAAAAAARRVLRCARR
ncbi:MAG: hypothetical protein ACYTF9_14025 [Planctomycetota bacterium]